MRGFASVFGFAISLSVYLLLFIVQIQVIVILRCLFFTVKPNTVVHVVSIITITNHNSFFINISRTQTCPNYSDLKLQWYVLSVCLTPSEITFNMFN